MNAKVIVWGWFCVAASCWVPVAHAVVTTRPSLLEEAATVLGIPSGKAASLDPMDRALATIRKDPSSLDAALDELADAWTAGVDWAGLATLMDAHAWHASDAEAKEWGQEHGDLREWYQTATYLVARANRRAAHSPARATRDLRLAVLLVAAHAGGSRGVPRLLQAVPDGGLAGVTREQLLRLRAIVADVNTASNECFSSGHVKLATTLDAALGERPLQAVAVRRILAEIERTRQFSGSVPDHAFLMSLCQEFLARVREDGDPQTVAIVEGSLKDWRQNEANPSVRRWLGQVQEVQTKTRRVRYVVVEDLRPKFPTTTTRPAIRPTTNPSSTPKA